MINLKKIEKNIDEVLAKETTESLTKWLLERRKLQAQIIGDQNDVSGNEALRVAVDFAEFIAKKKYTLSNAPRYGNGDYMWFITKDSIGQTTTELYRQFENETAKATDR